jgi:hypothetical protein
MKHQTSHDHFTPKMPKIKRFRLLFSGLKWLGLLIGVIILALVLTPFFIRTDGQANSLANFLNDHASLFFLIHLGFAVSALWWFPAIVKHKGKMTRASPEKIQEVIALKWWVMVVLLAFTLMLNFI